MRHAAGWSCAVLLAIVPTAVAAFPPYRTTDAETAAPWTLEVRLGLVRFRRDERDHQWTSPLARVNLALPERFEIVSEIEVLPLEGAIGDAAIGAKWVPFLRELSLGVELLLLLPVSSQGGAGVEGSLVATERWSEAVQTHLNATGFWDGRTAVAERGWKAGTVAELRLGRWRPGLELHAKHVLDTPLQMLAGVGLIVALGPLDLRTGLHAGLTNEAPDWIASLWVSGSHSFASDGDGNTP